MSSASEIAPHIEDGPKPRSAYSVHRWKIVGFCASAALLATAAPAGLAMRHDQQIADQNRTAERRDARCLSYVRQHLRPGAARLGVRPAHLEAQVIRDCRLDKIPSTVDVNDTPGGLPLSVRIIENDNQPLGLPTISQLQAAKGQHKEVADAGIHYADRIKESWPWGVMGIVGAGLLTFLKFGDGRRMTEEPPMTLSVP